MAANHNDINYDQQWHSETSPGGFQHEALPQMDLVHLVDPEKISTVSNLVSVELMNKCQEALQQQDNLALNIDNTLAEAGKIRADEIIYDYQHLRPNGKDGIDTPYTIGYAKRNNVEAELIASVKSDSLKKLMYDGVDVLSSQLLGQLLPVVGELHSNQIGGAVSIVETSKEYVMATVFFFAEWTKPPLSPEKVAIKKARRNLALLYNSSLDLSEEDYSTDSWSKLMFARARAKDAFKNKLVTLDEIQGATADLRVSRAGLINDIFRLKVTRDSDNDNK